MNYVTLKDLCYLLFWVQKSGPRVLPRTFHGVTNTVLNASLLSLAHKRGGVTVTKTENELDGILDGICGEEGFSDISARNYILETLTTLHDFVCLFKAMLSTIFVILCNF